MGKKVIAISGYPGSGKTTICETIVEGEAGIIYFDFGFLFRPLTYYLMNELKFTEEEIKKLVNSEVLFTKINFTYQIVGNKVRIGVNNRFYSDDQLFNPEMNLKTVLVGTMIGDRLTGKLREIIDELKQYGNVLLNARRPVEAYPNLDHHIFLQADFEKRVERKMVMNGEDYETTRQKLLQRDEKEMMNGFWQIFDFTEVIDTTDLSKAEVLDKILEVLKLSTVEKVEINNLTLVLGSYRCNKNCPYCIAKNNQKFSMNDALDKLDDILTELEDNKVKFKRFVLSGNGEPSMYAYHELLKVKEGLEKHSELFELIRVHSSGNIFFEPDKFKLFNSMEVPLEFEVLRVSLDPGIDMSVLGYKQDYLTSPIFSDSKAVKCDIALTDYLDYMNIKEDIEKFLEENPAISKIRFKKLLVGDNDETKQAIWVREHALDEKTIMEIMTKLGLEERKGVYCSLDGKIVYKPTGDYDHDIVISDGQIEDYNYNKYSVKMLKRKFGE